MKLVILLGFLSVLAACTSAPKNEDRPITPAHRSASPRAAETSGRQQRYAKLRTYQNKSNQTEPTAPYETAEDTVDYVGLQIFLKLDRSYDVLGYSERMFNTCEVGYGYSNSHNCEKKYFIVSHFRLVCRDSEGTISQILTAADLRPLSRRSIKWSVKTANGELVTDSDGYAQIAMIASQSQRAERLKIASSNDFLYLKAGELTQMITPKNWCD
ncbi:MAG: hypothetical protein H7328_06400 [Bdellovibrio sp.]|nr:hypothetical protein [Bdellovibrio sp.]